VKEVVSRLKAYIEAHPDVRDDSNRWVEGMGWDQTKWPGAQFPTAVRSSVTSGILDNCLVFHSRMILTGSLSCAADLLRLYVSMDTLHGCLHEYWN
jgi:hypothetical protein